MEHNAPSTALPPHTTPSPLKYPVSNLVTITQHVQEAAWKPASFTHKVDFDNCWRASDTSAANSWQVNPFRAPCVKSMPVTDDGPQLKTLDVETKYFIREGSKTSGMYIAASGILHMLFAGTPAHRPSTSTPATHSPLMGPSGRLGKVSASGPTYVTSTPFSTPVVELGRVSSPPEPQAERKSAKDAIAKKFFMTCSPFLRHSFPHPERDVKFLFSHRVTRGEKALFGDASHRRKYFS